MSCQTVEDNTYVKPTFDDDDDEDDDDGLEMMIMV